MVPMKMSNSNTNVIILLLWVLVTVSVVTGTCQEPSNATEVQADLMKKIETMYINDLPFLSMPNFLEAVKANIRKAQKPDARAARVDSRSSRRRVILTHVSGERRCRWYENATPGRKWDISRASTCPWSVALHHNNERIPKAIAVTRCSCKHCLTACRRPPCRRRTGLCRPVNTHMPVIMRKCVAGVYAYRIDIEAVPVGCTCIRPDPATTERVRPHRKRIVT